MDVICAMWAENRTGRITGNVRQLSRVCRCSDDEMASAINELEMTGTASVVDDNGVVTLINRRMEREHKERQLNALRQDRFRDKRRSNEPVTGDITQYPDNETWHRASQPTSRDMAEALEPIAKAQVDQPATPKTLTLNVGDMATQLSATRVSKLLAKALRVLGKDCMAFSGSTWRARAYENPDKLERVLNEMASQQREGKAVKNPGAYATKLWQEWA